MKVHKAESRGDFDEARVLFREYGASLDIVSGIHAPGSMPFFGNDMGIRRRDTRRN